MSFGNINVLGNCPFNKEINLKTYQSSELIIFFNSFNYCTPFHERKRKAIKLKNIS